MDLCGDGGDDLGVVEVDFNPLRNGHLNHRGGPVSDGRGRCGGVWRCFIRHCWWRVLNERRRVYHDWWVIRTIIAGDGSDADHARWQRDVGGKASLGGGIPFAEADVGVGAVATVWSGKGGTDDGETGRYQKG